jgi:6-phosphogluconolactonase
MTTRVRTLCVGAVVLATMWLAGCGHYTCGATFGNSSCTASGSGLSQGGNGTNSTAAFAFAVDEAGTIDGYTLATGGTSPTFGPTSGYTAPTVPTNQEGSGAVIAQEQYLYVAFAGTGQIYGYTIGTGGGLTSMGSPFSASYLVGEPSGGLWSMITNPAGTFLFMVDTSGMSVHVYQIGTGGALTQVAGSPFAVPFFPGNLGTDGLGKYLYVSGNTNPTAVAAFTIGTNGSLTAVPGSPFSYPMIQAQGDASGKFLIGVQQNTFGFSDLYVFSITQSGSTAGAITPVTGSPFATTYVPYSFAVQPNSNGNLIYTFGENATQTGYNPIEGYQLNTTSGALTLANGSPFSGISSGFWGQFDQSGQNLLVYGGVVNNGTVTTYLGALSVGSEGALTQPTSQLTIASPGFWAVTDPK